MKKKNKQKIEAFDEAFDNGEVSIDFSSGLVTQGLNKTLKLPPIDMPSWLVLEIEKIAKIQGNSRASIIRQLLAEAIEQKMKAA